jgi:hypothetical protein
MNMTLSEVLITFGEWWVVKTTREKYPGLMESGGNLRDFNKFTELHNRVMLIYPKLTPPEFKVSDICQKGCICIISQKGRGFKILLEVLFKD